MNGRGTCLTIRDDGDKSPASVADEAKDWLVGCMVDGMGRYLTVVPVEVEVQISTTWAGATDVSKPPTSTAKTLTPALRFYSLDHYQLKSTPCCIRRDSME